MIFALPAFVLDRIESEAREQGRPKRGGQFLATRLCTTRILAFGSWKQYMPDWTVEAGYAYCIHLVIIFVIGFLKGTGWNELPLSELANV